ncbi:MAG: hypothetical protein ABFS19_03005 [Thermodesulfobacteriota bacterium]
MSEQEIKFLPYKEAAKIVAAIQEEEDIHHQDRRILTVYNHDDKEVCWFDFEELLGEVGEIQDKEQRMEAVQNYVLHHIPDWALDI